MLFLQLPQNHQSIIQRVESGKKVDPAKGFSKLQTLDKIIGGFAGPLGRRSIKLKSLLSRDAPTVLGCPIEYRWWWMQKNIEKAKAPLLEGGWRLQRCWLELKCECSSIDLNARNYSVHPPQLTQKSSCVRKGRVDDAGVIY